MVDVCAILDAKDPAAFALNMIKSEDRCQRKLSSRNLSCASNSGSCALARAEIERKSQF